MPESSSRRARRARYRPGDRRPPVRRPARRRVRSPIGGRTYRVRGDRRSPELEVGVAGRRRRVVRHRRGPSRSPWSDPSAREATAAAPLSVGGHGPTRPRAQAASRGGASGRPRSPYLEPGPVPDRRRPAPARVTTALFTVTPPPGAARRPAGDRRPRRRSWAGTRVIPEPVRFGWPTARAAAARRFALRLRRATTSSGSVSGSTLSTSAGKFSTPPCSSSTRARATRTVPADAVRDRRECRRRRVGFPRRTSARSWYDVGRHRTRTGWGRGGARSGQRRALDVAVTVYAGTPTRGAGRVPRRRRADPALPPDWVFRCG